MKVPNLHNRNSLTKQNEDSQMERDSMSGRLVDITPHESDLDQHEEIGQQLEWLKPM